MCSNALHSNFRVPMMLKSWNHTFSFVKPTILGIHDVASVRKFWPQRRAVADLLLRAKLTWSHNPKWTPKWHPCIHHASIINGVVITIPPPTLCIGALGLHYVMGGGWELCTQSVISKRIRDNRYRGGRQVTLLTLLTLLTLFQLV